MNEQKEREKINKLQIYFRYLMEIIQLRKHFAMF